MSQRRQVVSVDIKSRTREGRRKGGGLEGSADGWARGISLCLVYPAGGPRDPDRALMSPTVPYPPNSPASCRSDVTGQLGMSRPHPPIPSACPLSPPRFQSLASHCDPGQSMEHVPNTDREAATHTHTLCSQIRRKQIYQT